jgi:hypothetical protein
MKELHFAWPSLTQLHVDERQRLVYDAARRAQLVQPFQLAQQLLWKRYSSCQMIYS